MTVIEDLQSTTVAFEIREHDRRRRLMTMIL